MGKKKKTLIETYLHLPQKINREKCPPLDIFKPSRILIIWLN